MRAGVTPSAIQEQLLRGERVAWEGQPDPSKHFSPADRFLIPFSLLWAGFMVFWIAAALGAGSEEEPSGFALFGVPFLLLGLYFVAGRFVYKAWRKRRTFYAVTDRRVLAVFRRRSQSLVEAAYIDTIPTINLQVRADGSGTILFGNPAPWQTWYANTGWEFVWTGGAASGTVAFYDIPDARQVSDLVTELRQEAA
jgi:hypothetical protein